MIDLRRHFETVRAMNDEIKQPEHAPWVRYLVATLAWGLGLALLARVGSCTASIVVGEWGP